MRILIDLPKSTLERLATIGAKRKQPRAAIVREALEQFVQAQEQPTTDEAFGLWRGGQDGLTRQRELRDEW